MSMNFEALVVEMSGPRTADGYQDTREEETLEELNVGAVEPTVMVSRQADLFSNFGTQMALPVNRNVIWRPRPVQCLRLRIWSDWFREVRRIAPEARWVELCRMLMVLGKPLDRLRRMGMNGRRSDKVRAIKRIMRITERQIQRLRNGYRHKTQEYKIESP